MRIRTAKDGDAAAIARLETDLFGTDAWSERQVLEELSGDRRHLVVATDGDAVVGYATTVSAVEVVDLNRIAVTVTHQRKGVARLLLAEVMGAASARGATRMLLEVSSENSAALAFYERSGFTEIDRRPRYYRDGSDAIVMELALHAPSETRQEDTVHG
jgi:ribosomal-protein-alanine acetyltransferase